MIVDVREVKAVGLRYDPGHGLPQLVFKGVGSLADEAVRRSIRMGGPRVVKNAELVNQLYRLPIDAPIGTDLFRAVAIVMAHVLAVDVKRNERGSNV